MNLFRFFGGWAPGREIIRCERSERPLFNLIYDRAGLQDEQAVPCPRLYFGTVDPRFRIEYLCRCDLSFIVEEENGDLSAKQEEDFVLCRVQMAVWTEVSPRFQGIEQAVDGIVQTFMKVVVHA